MEDVARAIGAEPVSWSKRLDCCGAGFSLSRVDSVVRLGHEIIAAAREASARAIVVACPMCHSNLDFRQMAIARRKHLSFEMPILFITQMVGLGLGIPGDRLGLGRHFIGTGSVVQGMEPVKTEPATTSGGEN
jgi:heterodisulfide reductase subunit B